MVLELFPFPSYLLKDCFFHRIVDCLLILFGWICPAVPAIRKAWRKPCRLLPPIQLPPPRPQGLVSLCPMLPLGRARSFWRLLPQSTSSGARRIWPSASVSSPSLR